MTYWPGKADNSSEIKKMQARRDIGKLAPQIVIAAAANNEPEAMQLLQVAELMAAGYQVGIGDASAVVGFAVSRKGPQSLGKHPAPCARFCEAKAYEITVRNLEATVKDLQKRLAVYEAGGVAKQGETGEN